MYNHMKKNRKLLLFTVSILFTFFGFINKVSAVTKCYYALPFSSYDYINDSQYNFTINEDDDYSEVNLSNVVRNSGSSYVVDRFSKQLTSTGFMFLEVDPDTKKFKFTSWNKYEKTQNIKFPDAQDSNLFKGKCPKYITIGQNANLEESTKNGYSKFLKSQYYLDLLNYRYGDNATGDQLLNLVENAQSGKKIVFPIFYDTYKGLHNYDYEPVKIYNDIYTQKWKILLEQVMNEMESACGNDWLQYTNVSGNNYGDLKGQQGAFIKYAFYSKDLNKGIDKDASESCKNTRRRYLKTWLSFYDYWTTMASGYVEPTNAKLCVSVAKENGSFPATCVYMSDIFSRYTAFFNEATDAYNYMVNSGEQRIQDHVDLEAKKITTNEKEIKIIDSYLQTLKSDLCSGLCSASIHMTNLLSSTDFDNCITNKKNTHDTCYAKQDECISSKCGSCSHMSGSAKEGCLSSCQNSLETCMSDNGYDTALNNRRTKISDLEDRKRILQSEIDDIKESKIYTYSDDPLAQIEWKRAKYVPKCTDIKVLTYLWSIVKYLAPFLLMIFTGFDYLKVVMAADEAAMKKIKKSIPKRLIAFILLLVMPLLLKIFMENFGTNGSNKLGYLKCILTGDTTSGADETTDTSTSTDDTTSNTESNKSN